MVEILNQLDFHIIHALKQESSENLILDLSVKPFNHSVRPGMPEFYRPMLDFVFSADNIKGMNLFGFLVFRQSLV